MIVLADERMQPSCMQSLSLPPSLSVMPYNKSPAPNTNYTSTCHTLCLTHASTHSLSLSLSLAHTPADQATELRPHPATGDTSSTNKRTRGGTSVPIDPHVPARKPALSLPAERPSALLPTRDGGAWDEDSATSRQDQ